MDFSRVAESIRTALGTDVTDEDVQSALVDVDFDSVKASAAARYRHEVWDRVSPINGVPAEDVINSSPEFQRDGDILLVYRDDRVLIIQPFDPKTGNPIDETSAPTIGADQVASISESEAYEELTRTIAPKVSNNRANRKNVDGKKVEELQATVDQLVLDALMGGPIA